MNPKEKAKELVEKFKAHSHGFDTSNKPTWDGGIYHAKQCALIAVEEIIDLLKNALTEWQVLGAKGDISKHWQQVKEEIEKL